MLELSIAADEADDRITRSGFQGATSHVSFTHQPAQSETSGSYHDASEVDQAVAATVDSHTSLGEETVRDDRSVRQLDTSVTATQPITTTTVFNPTRSLPAAVDSSSIFHPITTTAAVNSLHVVDQTTRYALPTITASLTETVTSFLNSFNISPLTTSRQNEHLSSTIRPTVATSARHVTVSTAVTTYCCAERSSFSV